MPHQMMTTVSTLAHLRVRSIPFKVSMTHNPFPGMRFPYRVDDVFGEIEDHVEWTSFMQRDRSRSRPGARRDSDEGEAGAPSSLHGVESGESSLGGTDDLIPWTIPL